MIRTLHSSVCTTGCALSGPGEPRLELLWAGGVITCDLMLLPVTLAPGLRAGGGDVASQSSDSERAMVSRGARVHQRPHK